MDPVLAANQSALFNLAELRRLGGLKAGNLLAVDPQLYPKFMRHLSRNVRRDEVTKNLVVLTGCSAYTPEPINLFLRGESSIGKTYNVVEAMTYFPKEDVWLLGGLSPTALIHQHGILVDKNGEVILPSDKPDKEASAEEKEAWRNRLKDARYLIELKGKIMVFLEAPHYETFNMLRPILSHDAYEISYKFTDKSGKGQLQTQHVVIRGWPATIFCSTKEKYVQDLATRGFSHTPETTEQKYREANVLTGSKAAFPWKFEEDFDFMLLEGYIRFLKNNLQDFKALVPFGVEFAKKYPSKFPRSMRDFKHILNLIKVSALFHFAQRPVLVRKITVEIPGEDPTVPGGKEAEEQYVMAIKWDYDLVMVLWNKIRETTETSAPGHIIKFYHEVVREVAREKNGEFLIEDLTDKWNSKFEDKKSSDVIRKWVDFLCDVGYISKREDPENKKRNMLKVIKENEENGKYTQFRFSEFFGLDSFKAWLNKANSISEKNQICLKENPFSDGDASCEDVFNRCFLSQREDFSYIVPDDSKVSLSESAEKNTEKQKSVYVRNFQQGNSESEKSSERVTLDDVKYCRWTDEFYGEHECTICGYKKPTSWKAELFKGPDVWVCEDCRWEWEKRRTSAE